MFARAKGIAIIALVSLCTLSLMAGRSARSPGPRPRGEQRSDSSAGTDRVLTEAFVVEVNLPALARLEVSPIGQEPHAVSVADILKCLDKGQGRVIGGAKAASESPSPTKVDAKGTTYVRLETGTPGQVNVNPYQSGTQFSVGASLVSDSTASVEFSFAFVRFVQKVQTPGVPPDTMTWNWSGGVLLERGTPQIVAATQDQERAVFLLLTAHILDE
jgi:hypothetical protein